MSKQSNGWGLLPVAKMDKATWNYKGDDEEKAEKLRSNIERNGVLENIIVRQLEGGRYEVVNGNHRLDAFVALGIESIMCYDLGAVSLRVAKRIAIETNETRFQTDHLRLAEEMKDLLAEFDLDDLATTMPYTSDEIGGMVELLDYDWTDVAGSTGGDGEGGQNTRRPVRCPGCGHEFTP